MKNVHEIEIEVKDKEWKDILDKVFKKKAKDVKIDGFRKGNVPKDIYIKKYGIESLYMDAVDEALKGAYVKALKESKLIPVIEPKIDIKHICEDCVTFLITITTKPDIKLGAYKNLNIKKEKIQVTKEEIDAELDNIRNKFAEIVVKEEGTLVNGNTAVIDFEGYVDGKALEGGTGKNYPLEIGSNTFIPGFEEKLIGMKIGETKEINLRFPDNYTEDLKNKDVTFKVTLQSIKERILPELNKDFYADLGYDKVKDEESLRKEIEKEVAHKKEHDVDDKYVEALLEKASSNMKIDLNPEIIDGEINRMIGQYEQQFKMQGLSLDQYFEFTKGNIEDLKKNMQPEAEKRVKYRFLLEEIASKEKFEISDQELKEEAKRLAGQYNMEETEFLKEFGGLDMVRYDLEMRKAIEILKN